MLDRFATPSDCLYLQYNEENYEPASLILVGFVRVTRPCAARTRMRVYIFVEPLLCSCRKILSPAQRREEERGNSENVSALSAEAYHHNLARDGFTESTRCCVQKIFRHGVNKIHTLPCYGILSAIFYVFKVLKLF
jgi:hypothetical protein